MYTISTVKFEDSFSDVATDIMNGKIIGWYQGRSESGPRALGNRSILADPRDPNMKNKINNRVKHREPYRPFAPSVLSEHVQNWFDDITDSKYMLKICDVKKEKQHLIPAVVHVDGTARLQSVSRNDNLLFYLLINEFYLLTGIPMVLNTSFNIKGEPIVETPEDAFKCFMNTEIDILILGNYKIRKEK